MKSETLPSPEQKTTIQVIDRMTALLDALAKYPDPVSTRPPPTAFSTTWS
jgi:hypothetical protein